MGRSDNWQRINAVALNLSYSYIAGLIFYLFTSTLPYYFRKTKVAKIIKEKKGLIYGRLQSCAECVYPIAQDPSYSRQSIVTMYSLHSIREMGHLGMPIHDHLYAQRKDIVTTINGLLIYMDFLSERDIRILEGIKESLFFSYIIMLQNAIMDTPERRVKLAEELWNTLELAKPHKEYYQ